MFHVFWNVGIASLKLWEFQNVGFEFRGATQKVLAQPHPLPDSNDAGTCHRRGRYIICVSTLPRPEPRVVSFRIAFFVDPNQVSKFSDLLKNMEACHFILSFAKLGRG